MRERTIWKINPTYQLVGAIVNRIVGCYIVVPHPLCIGIDPAGRHRSQKEQYHCARNPPRCRLSFPYSAGSHVDCENNSIRSLAAAVSVVAYFYIIVNTLLLHFDKLQVPLLRCGTQKRPPTLVLQDGRSVHTAKCVHGSVEGIVMRGNHGRIQFQFGSPTGLAQFFPL